MNHYSLEVIFEAGKSTGQIWQYHNLTEQQVHEAYESLTLKNLRESAIYVIDNRNKQNKISYDEFVFNC